MIRIYAFLEQDSYSTPKYRRTGKLSFHSWISLIFDEWSCHRRVEQSVYGLLRTRDMAMARYKEFSIPVQWMLDSGIVGKVCYWYFTRICRYRRMCNFKMDRPPFSGVVFVLIHHLPHRVFLSISARTVVATKRMPTNPCCVNVMQIKLASVKLARLYMKRVSEELDNAGSVNEPVREFLLLQGVRFAFRVHQVLFLLSSFLRYECIEI